MTKIIKEIPKANPTIIIVYRVKIIKGVEVKRELINIHSRY